MTDPTPSPDSGQPVPKRCENCSRALVTSRRIAEAVHSGCALTREKHDLDQCPSKKAFLMDGQMIHGYIESHADEP